MKKALSLVMMLVMAGCSTDTDEVQSTLRKAGFTNVVVGGLSPFACSEDDKMGRSFTAQNANGQSVEGVVCCGVFKGCTVRF